jgi:hypothetical protein
MRLDFFRYQVHPRLYLAYPRPPLELSESADYAGPSSEIKLALQKSDRNAIIARLRLVRRKEKC